MRAIVIMAGGSGKRFWPLSRETRPKQLLALAGERTMVAETVERAATLVGRDQVYIVAGPHLREGLQAAVDLPAENFLTEPEGRNTAPCLAFAAAVIAARHGAETVMGVLAADSLIRDVETFDRNADLAFEYAERHDALMTLGIRPDHPNTGFGYLEVGPAVHEDERGTVHRVESFREKPDEATAREYVDAGNYLWNSGMFYWKIATFMEGLSENAPALAEGALRIRKAVGEDDFDAVVREVFDGWEKISIDYALMEKADNVYAVAGEFDWDDVGTWEALARTFPTDNEGNLVVGDAVTMDTRDCIVHCKPTQALPEGHTQPLVATLGVEDLVIVQCQGAVLVCARDRVQDIKELLGRIEEAGHGEHL